jgi:hypothetical protein
MPISAVSRRTLAAACALAPLALVAAGPALAAPTGPPPVTITQSTPSADNANGDIFITPTGGTANYLNGAEIIDRTGKVIWFHPSPSNATDFRTQTYQGRPVLTWTQGGVNAQGVGQVTDYIYDTRYQQIATVQAGNGYTADSHEFLITPQNTALITIYGSAHADLTSIGGSANQLVTDGIVQEIDIPTGKVLWQWDSKDHVPYSDSHQPLPASPTTAWDWFHINAVHFDTDGDLLINSRHTWTTYKVDRTTGNVIWELGGKESSFSEQAAPGQVLDGAGEILAWEHDPEALGNNTYTWFDNESAGTPLLPTSRSVTVKLDTINHVATLVSSNNQPEGLAASSQGDVQTTANGNQLIGWGNLNHFSEFDPAGNLVLEAAYPTGVNSYRAYRLPWKAATFTTATTSGGSYSATVSAYDGNLTPTGTVTFTGAGTTLCTATLTNGTGSCGGSPATSSVVAAYSGDGDFTGSSYEATAVSGGVAGSVPATLALSIGSAPSFGSFAAGTAADYTASTTADVLSTAGNANLSVADASATAPGHLVNGAFSLPSPLQAQASSAAGSGGALATLPATLETWSAPVSHDPVTLAFSQHIAADDALRTGAYTKALTFTLSTTTP